MFSFSGLNFKPLTDQVQVDGGPPKILSVKEHYFLNINIGYHDISKVGYQTSVKFYHQSVKLVINQ